MGNVDFLIATVTIKIVNLKITLNYFIIYYKKYFINYFINYFTNCTINYIRNYLFQNCHTNLFSCFFPVGYCAPFDCIYLRRTAENVGDNAT